PQLHPILQLQRRPPPPPLFPYTTLFRSFHTVDVQTRALAQTLHTDKRGATVQAHTLTTWQQLGLPNGLQLDNDAAFNGGYKVPRDRKSTRLNSSHDQISYAVFCLKKKIT